MHYCVDTLRQLHNDIIFTINTYRFVILRHIISISLNDRTYLNKLENYIISISNSLKNLTTPIFIYNNSICFSIKNRGNIPSKCRNKNNIHGILMCNKRNYAWNKDLYLENEYINLHCIKYHNNRNTNKRTGSCCNKCPFNYEGFIEIFINNLINGKDEFFELSI